MHQSWYRNSWGSSSSSLPICLEIFPEAILTDQHGLCGDLNRNRLMCVNAWPIKSGTIRRSGLDGGRVSLGRF